MKTGVRQGDGGVCSLTGGETRGRFLVSPKDETRNRPLVSRGTVPLSHAAAVFHDTLVYKRLEE